MKRNIACNRGSMNGSMQRARWVIAMNQEGTKLLCDNQKIRFMQTKKMNKVR